MSTNRSKDFNSSVSKFRFLTSGKPNTTPEMAAADPRLQRHFTSFATYMRTAKTEFLQRWNENDLSSEVTLEDFVLIKTLGIGGFGRVMLASKQAKLEKEYYAIKIMDKHNIIKYKQIDHSIQELRILDAVRFSFLVSLIYYFKNNCYLFCVMPFVAGGEMFNLLSKEGQFEENLAKFYAAQVVLAFEYLHANGVIYRDLKPENIMIDMQGYLKVTDFGFCKKIDDKRTWTLCGTPEYLAPEVILSQGYNFSVDWWTLGILIFEMVAGRPPFSSPDPMKLYGMIVNCKYRMPDKFSRPLQNLIQNLVQTDRDKRYGVLRNGVKDIKIHDWFKTIDWNTIFYKRMRPLYVPKASETPTNTVNFERYTEEPLRQNSSEEYPKEFQLIALSQKP